MEGEIGTVRMLQSTGSGYSDLGRQSEWRIVKAGVANDFHNHATSVGTKSISSKDNSIESA